MIDVVFLCFQNNLLIDLSCQMIYIPLCLLDDFTPIEYKDLPKAAKPRELPPYNGFGSEDDSLANCLSLIAKPPRRDFIKFMEKDR